MNRSFKEMLSWVVAWLRAIITSPDPNEPHHEAIRRLQDALRVHGKPLPWAAVEHVMIAARVLINEIDDVGRTFGEFSTAARQVVTPSDPTNCREVAHLYTNRAARTKEAVDPALVVTALSGIRKALQNRDIDAGFREQALRNVAISAGVLGIEPWPAPQVSG